ncbi:MAG: superoxide dismutase family protein [Allosphingosinicella sp.]
MDYRSSIWAGLCVFGLAACTMNEEVTPASASAEARAAVRDTDGRVVANATATPAGDQLRVRIEAAGLAPGTYGVHLHAVGRCDPPDFTTAGPHWNPAGRQHGSQNPQGPHLGDLPNLMVGTDGGGSLEFGIPGSGLSGGPLALLDADGAAILVHASPDDYRTDPSGNSGARIACGMFG